MTHLDKNSGLKMVKIDMEAPSGISDKPSEELEPEISNAGTVMSTSVISAESCQISQSVAKSSDRLAVGSSSSSRNRHHTKQRIFHRSKPRQTPPNHRTDRLSTIDKGKSLIRKTSKRTPTDAPGGSRYTKKELVKCAEDSLSPAIKVGTQITQGTVDATTRQHWTAPTSAVSIPLSKSRSGSSIYKEEANKSKGFLESNSKTILPTVLWKHSVFKSLFQNKVELRTNVHGSESNGRKTRLSHSTDAISGKLAVSSTSIGKGCRAAKAVVTAGQSRATTSNKKGNIFSRQLKNLGWSAKSHSIVPGKENEAMTTGSSKSQGAVTNSNEEIEKQRLDLTTPRASSRKLSTDVFMLRFATNVPRQTLNLKEAKPAQVTTHKGGKVRASTYMSSAYVISPEGDGMYLWLAFLSLIVLYNAWTVIAREAFTDIQKGYDTFWFFTDTIADMIYICDIGVQMRTGYLEMGMLVCDTKKLALHYVKSSMFIYDLVALIPLDFLQLLVGIHPLLRFPRFIKVYRTYQFMNVVGMKALFPNVWRVANLTHMLFLGAHWFAAFYFMLSKAENHQGSWIYPEPTGEFAPVSRQYLKSLYWATMTLTNIGDIRHPETNWEYSLAIGSYLIGVFIFAAIVGQVGSVIASRNAARTEFERLLDGAKSYMHDHEVPSYLQFRVVRWYNYAWFRKRIGGGGGSLEGLSLLPDKLKTELALFVNMNTLKKVTMFQDCEPEFLCDVVLKMKALIFTPGDMVCRKGEVAKEMFIISDGMLEIISPTGAVVATMVTGDFFGEIGILNVDSGINRRTADVKSVGYSELLVLLRSDVLSALKDYPNAERVLKTCALKRLKSLRDLAESPVDDTELQVNEPSIKDQLHPSSSVHITDLTQTLIAQRNRDGWKEAALQESQPESVSSELSNNVPPISLTSKSKSSPVVSYTDLVMPARKESLESGCWKLQMEDNKVQLDKKDGNSNSQTEDKEVRPDKIDGNSNLQTEDKKEQPDKTEGNSSNNNIYTTLSHSDTSKVDDSLTCWQPPFVRFRNMAAGDNVPPCENDWETQICRETNVQLDNSITCNDSPVDHDNNDGAASNGMPLQPLLSRVDDGEVMEGDMKDLLDGVQTLFDEKMKRIHKYYQTKMERLQADILRKQRRIEELESRETL